MIAGNVAIVSGAGRGGPALDASSQDAV